MKQIFFNNFVVFVIPFLVGILARFLFRKYCKAWLVTAISIALTVVAFVVEKTINSYGSEKYALSLAMAVSVFIGSLLMGIILRIINQKSCK